MALLSELVKTIAEVEGLEEVQVGWIARHLREAGLISQAGRGRGAAHMSVTDAANLLIAVNASNAPKQSSKAVHEFRSLKTIKNLSHDRPLVEADIEEDDNIASLLSDRAGFGEALERLIEMFKSHFLEPGGYLLEYDVRVKFIRPTSKGEIYLGDLSDLHYTEATHLSFENSDPGGGSNLPDKKDESTISQLTLSRIGELLAK